MLPAPLQGAAAGQAQFAPRGLGFVQGVGLGSLAVFRRRGGLGGHRRNGRLRAVRGAGTLHAPAELQRVGCAQQIAVVARCRVAELAANPAARVVAQHGQAGFGKSETVGGKSVGSHGCVAVMAGIR